MATASGAEFELRMIHKRDADTDALASAVNALPGSLSATATGQPNELLCRTDGIQADLAYLPIASDPGAMQQRQCPRKSLHHLESPPNGAETGRLYDLSDIVSRSAPMHQVAARNWPNATATGLLNDPIDFTFSSSRCVASASMYPRLGPIRRGSGGQWCAPSHFFMFLSLAIGTRSRQRLACAVVNATMPRKSINATASSPNALGSSGSSITPPTLPLGRHAASNLAVKWQWDLLINATLPRHSPTIAWPSDEPKRKAHSSPMRVDRRNVFALDDYRDDRHIKIKDQRRPMMFLPRGDAMGPAGQSSSP
ncbi:hypothetical protein FB107DRAFT_273683 [Schizophyllum commune]